MIDPVELNANTDTINNGYWYYDNTNKIMMIEK